MAAKPYTLLREAHGRTEQVAVAKYALRGRERLGLMRPYRDALLLHGMRWSDEVRDPTELTPDDVDLTEKEIDEALTLLEAMSVERLADVDESALTDHYRESLLEVIEAKAEHREPKAAEGEEAAPTGRVMDLMAALEESVAKAKASRGETGEHATVHEMQKPKKKAAARKAPAKKAAARKTAAKKTTRRKSA
ncbi:Ku protein [Streptomyces sp. NPDC059875]|uniref:Ku protein n=1 Tax=unclassified Streptomyces TaxID=2593676 RepID=UPI0036464752